MLRAIVWILSIPAIWLGTTWLFWTGFIGSDDIFYVRYAALFHRTPLNWWEFRMPFILAVRASLLTFGASEFAACLPNLLASVVIMAAVAWFVDWPRALNWRSQFSMILAAVLPLHVALRTCPVAPTMAAALLAVGTACLLKSSGRWRHLGAIGLAAALLTHESSAYYIGFFILMMLVFDAKRSRRPVLACIFACGCAVVVECMIYQILIGDPLARWRMSAHESAAQSGLVDPDLDIRGLAFLVWPLKSFVFNKSFGFGWAVLFTSGLLVWKHLAPRERILLGTTLATWLWLGYGTKIPWAYKPFARQHHLYFPLIFPMAVMLPITLRLAFASRDWIARGILAVLVLVHLGSLAAGGRWGSDFDVSRELLDYARWHPDRVYLTDVSTMNQMYAAGGFRLPLNVVCLNGPAVQKHLLLNKEPPGTSLIRFPRVAIQGILLNLDRKRASITSDYFAYLDKHEGRHVRIAPVRTKPLFMILNAFVGPNLRAAAIRSRGGVLVEPAGREDNRWINAEADRENSASIHKPIRAGSP